MVHFAHACQPRLRGAAFALLLDGFLGATVRSVIAAHVGRVASEMGLTLP